MNKNKNKIKHIDALVKCDFIFLEIGRHFKSKSQKKINYTNRRHMN
jgi:hypothetical protein